MTKYILLSFLIASIGNAADKPVVKTVNDKDLKWGPCPEIFPKGCEIGVLHGDPAKKGTDVYLRLPSNYEIPAHTHTSAEHMSLVAGRMEVKYKGEAPMNLQPGSFAYGPAQHAHKATCTSAESCVLFISFDEPIDAKAYTGTL